MPSRIALALLSLRKILQVASVPHPSPFKPLGRCCYCGAADVALSDEHVIPFSLEGTLILPTASCLKCADITKRFEQTVARGMLGNFRARNDGKTRRKKERPTHLPIFIQGKDGQEKEVLVPTKNHPGTFALFEWGPPGYFLGRKPKEDPKTIRILGHKGLKLEPQIDDPWHTIVMVNENAFLRMLAKIAHCFAVGIVENKSQHLNPMLTDLILGKSRDLYHFIGSSTGPIPPSGDDFHILRLDPVRFRGQVLLIARIRLFQFLGTPVYTVIVGELDGDISGEEVINL